MKNKFFICLLFWLPHSYGMETNSDLSTETESSEKVWVTVVRKLKHLQCAKCGMGFRTVEAMTLHQQRNNHRRRRQRTIKVFIQMLPGQTLPNIRKKKQRPGIEEVIVKDRNQIDEVTDKCQRGTVIDVISKKVKKANLASLPD